MDAPAGSYMSYCHITTSIVIKTIMTIMVIDHQHQQNSLHRTKRPSRKRGVLIAPPLCVGHVR